MRLSTIAKTITSVSVRINMAEEIIGVFSSITWLYLKTLVYAGVIVHNGGTDNLMYYAWNVIDKREWLQ